MKRKLLLSIFFIFLFCILFLNMSSVQAVSYIEESEPEYSEVLNCLFANGTDIIIQSGEEGKTLIVWGEDSSLLIPTDAVVFGGGHNTDGILRKSQITMNGGTVDSIFGGGLHISQVETSNVIVNGGIVTNGIYGGGAATFTDNKGEQCLDEECASRYSYYSGDAIQSSTIVNNANVVINNISTVSNVYGGGEGISNTTLANVIIRNGTLNWVTSGGSNGYTRSAILEILGGNIQVVQSVNNGTLENSNMQVSGGKIENLYIGAETDNENANGTVGRVSLDVTRVNNNNNNSIIKVLDIGTNAGKVIGTEGNNTTIVSARMLNGTVETLNLQQFENVNLTRYVFVTIDNIKYELEVGKRLIDLPQIAKIKNVEGKEFEKFINKATQQEFSETAIISSNIEITTVYKDKEPEEGETIINRDTNTNIKLEALANVLPKGTTMEVSEITQISMYNSIKEMLPAIKSFRAFDIKLKSNNVNVQPNGTVKLSIPIPGDFDMNNLIIYRIENGERIEYPVNVYMESGIKYAGFDTNHFSLYVLAERNVIEGPSEDEFKGQPGIQDGQNNNDHILDNEPKTGIFSAAGFSKVILLIALIGFVVSRKMKRK